ncbi:MAG TPA: hypothetical protein VLQ45_28730 [Thermoanaerobaculia bacterium]|nr:hypothetical protein [Thermoanaerobaculia bacterium]
MEKIADSRYRLKQLILLIADEMRESDFFGVTKLNKVLFRSEMASYRELGHKRMGENIKPELAFVEDPGTSIPLSHYEEQRARKAIEGFLARNPAFPRARS